MWIVALFGFLNKLLDFLNPWSAYWADKAKKRDTRKEEARKKMDESAKKEGADDAFIDGLNDSNNP